MNNLCGEKMDIEQIERDRTYIDYVTLNVIRSILMNNLEQMGQEVFLGTYYTKFDFFLKTWNPASLRYIIALLEYLNPAFSFNGNIMMGKLIVADEGVFESVMGGNTWLLDKLANNTPTAFRKYGILEDMQHICGQLRIWHQGVCIYR